MSTEIKEAATPEQLGWMIKRVQHGHHRALDQGLARIGVSLVQWNALREIDRHPGCSQHQLAEHTFNSDQAFGTLANRLAERGWVERRPGAGRATIHRLTSDGAAVLRAGQKIMSQVVGASFASLHRQERVELGRLLSKVLEGRRNGLGPVNH